jgi:hypothetical protein
MIVRRFWRKIEKRVSNSSKLGYFFPNFSKNPLNCAHSFTYTGDDDAGGMTNVDTSVDPRSNCAHEETARVDKMANILKNIFIYIPYKIFLRCFIIVFVFVAFLFLCFFAFFFFYLYSLSTYKFKEPI